MAASGHAAIRLLADRPAEGAVLTDWSCCTFCPHFVVSECTSLPLHCGRSYIYLSIYIYIYMPPTAPTSRHCALLLSQLLPSDSSLALLKEKQNLSEFQCPENQTTKEQHPVLGLTCPQSCSWTYLPTILFLDLLAHNPVLGLICPQSCSGTYLPTMLQAS